MADELKFFSYRRSRAARSATPEAGRLKGRLVLELAETQGGRRDAVPVEFQLMGPGDVRGLKPAAVRRTYPAHGAFNVETDKCVYAEFTAEDLPWRYAPVPNSDTMRAWLLLVVATPDEATLLPGNQVVFSPALVAAYEALAHAAKGHLWAHVQEDGGGAVSRLLSPRVLEPARSYVAVIVPAFSASGALNLAAGTRIPAYYAWHFTTSQTPGSFIDLAQRLYPLDPIPDNMGSAPLAYQTSATQKVVQPEVLAGGALVGLDEAPATAWSTSVQNHFAAIRPSAVAVLGQDDAGRPLVQLPLYGEPWLEPEREEPAWMNELNDDPRYRVAAGLGTWAGIEWQDRIVDAAAQQLGAFHTASRRIRQLTAGLAAARSLWDRRLPSDQMQRLQVLAPVLSRMAAASGGSALDQLTARGRPLPPALFSSAARRLLRPGTARARLVGNGALAPGALFERMNTCPPDDPRPPDGLPHADTLSDGELDRRIAERLRDGGEIGISGIAFEETWPIRDDEREGRGAAGLEEDESFENLFQALQQNQALSQALLKDVYAPLPARPCEREEMRANLPALADRLEVNLTPHGDEAFLIRRVLATVQGLDDQPLTPPELCLDFHIPAWKFLREFAKDWFLPGLGQLQIKTPGENGELVPDLTKDPVIAVKANGRFTDAFLIGFNQQALAELRWRNVPVATGCTPLRRFWEPLRQGPDGDLEAGEDIIGVHAWQSDTRLGNTQHETPEAHGQNLVLVFKSPLWRRYPETLIYLLPKKPGLGWEPDWDAAHIQPNLHVEIERDVVAFGFSQEDSVLNDHWVVIEQVPRGVAFYNKSKWPVPETGEHPDAKPNSAKFAEVAFSRPVRVLIRGTELQPPA